MPTDSIGRPSLKPALLGAAVTCALAMTQAQAVGLGGIEVKSKLNEPFVAEIPLNIDYSGQTDDMVVHLASPEEFERVGLERPHEMSANLNFRVTRNARGEPVILITTPQRMTDPYVSFLLEAEWGNGKMVREYTAMLEPPHTVEVPHAAITAPTVASTALPVVTAPVASGVEPETEAGLQPAPSPAAQAAASAASTSQTQIAPEPSHMSSPTAPEPVAAAPQSEPVPPAPVSTPQPQTESPPPPVAETPPAPAEAPPAPAEAPPAPAEAPPPAPRSGAITVSRGQTLGAIAGQMHSPDVSLNRVMIALQRANPDAFVSDNINRLKAGAVLHVPDAEAMRAITPDEANALVHEQVESWRRGAQPAPQLQPEQAATAASKHASGNAASSSRSVTAPNTPASAAVSAGAQAAHAGPRGAHLEILPPAGKTAGHGQSGSSEGGSGSEVRAELAQTKEELTARKAEINDLKAHVSDLEKIKTDSQKMLSLKDSQMAALQQRLAELEKKDAEAAAASPEAASPAAVASGSTVPESAASSSVAGQSSPATTAAVSMASPATASASVASSPASVPAKPAAVVPAMPREPESPWYLSAFRAGGRGLILFAGLLCVMLRRPSKVEPLPRRRNFDASALAATIHDPKPHSTFEPEADQPQEKPYIASSAPAPVAKAPDLPVPAAPPVALRAVTPAPEPEPEASESSPPPVVAAQPVPVPADGVWTVPTRIEAARAYIENGDVDSARTMLEAALIDGNAAQQEEAFKLLDMIDSW